jgi:hypothetical protein
MPIANFQLTFSPLWHKEEEEENEEETRKIISLGLLLKHPVSPYSDTS